MSDFQPDQPKSASNPEGHDTQWWYARGDQPEGPVDREALRELYRSGALTKASLVWAPSMSDWLPLGRSSIFTDWVQAGTQRGSRPTTSGRGAGAPGTGIGSGRASTGASGIGPGASRSMGPAGATGSLGSSPIEGLPFGNPLSRDDHGFGRADFAHSEFLHPRETNDFEDTRRFPDSRFGLDEAPRSSPRERFLAREEQRRREEAAARAAGGRRPVGDGHGDPAGLDPADMGFLDLKGFDLGGTPNPDRSLPVVGKPGKSGYPPAGPARRFAARLIDLVIELGIATALGHTVAPWLRNVLGDALPSYPVAVALVFLALLLIVEPLIHGVVKTTPGKALLGVRATRRDGWPLSAGTHFERQIVVFFQGLGLLVLSPLTAFWQYARLNRGLQASYDGDERLVTTTRRSSSDVLGAIPLALVGLMGIVWLGGWLPSPTTPDAATIEQRRRTVELENAARPARDATLPRTANGDAVVSRGGRDTLNATSPGGIAGDASRSTDGTGAVGRSAGDATRAAVDADAPADARAATDAKVIADAKVAAAAREAASKEAAAKDAASKETLAAEARRQADLKKAADDKVLAELRAQAAAGTAGTMASAPEATTPGAAIPPSAGASSKSAGTVAGSPGGMTPEAAPQGADAVSPSQWKNPWSGRTVTLQNNWIVESSGDRDAPKFRAVFRHRREGVIVSFSGFKDAPGNLDTLVERLKRSQDFATPLRFGYVSRLPNGANMVEGAGLRKTTDGLEQDRVRYVRKGGTIWEVMRARADTPLDAQESDDARALVSALTSTID